MKNLSAFKIALLLAALLFLIILGFAITGHIASAGPLVIALFLSLAFGCRGYAPTKGLAYTVIIFAAVSTALYYPQYFLVWGGFKLSGLITPLIQIIMFGMGTSMGLKDFAGVIKTPKGVFIGVTSHFIIMPLIGFSLAKLSGLPPEIAAGIILIGCSPNGLASNVISYLAKANLALSITITAVSTLLAPFVTPFLMQYLAGAFVKINAMNMMWDIIKMVIIPIGGGILFNRLFGASANAHGDPSAPAAPSPASVPNTGSASNSPAAPTGSSTSAAPTRRNNAAWLQKAMPIVSMSGIAMIIVVITAAGRDSLLTIGPLLVLFVLLHNLSGYTLGYWTGRLFRMEERDCRTMAIEVGMQNGGLASGLAKEMGKLATVGLAPAIFGPLMNVTGSILASYWHRKPPKERNPAGMATTPDPASTSSSSAPTAVLLFALAATLLITGCTNTEKRVTIDTGDNYPAYGGNKANNRYSPLKQINLQNVKNLHVAWTYDAREPLSSDPWSQQIQCQPIVVNGVLYGTTANLNLFALNAATGQRLWQNEPPKEAQKFNTSRGLIYWEKGDDHRLFYSAGSSLYAINALNGQPIPTFGSSGHIDLHEGLGAGLHHDVTQLSVTASTPGVICRDVLVTGSSVSEGGDAAPGHIRGFDVVTGKLLWTFHTIPQPGEPGYETWPPGAYEYFGGANSWGGGSADESRGMVYFGTGSPSSDFYGGDRAGKNLFGNCIVALDAVTGKLKWYFQTVHHDLWDRDMPCPPNLVTVQHDGHSVDALVQATKDGMIYVLDRDSGKSLFPVVEYPVPIAGLPGEHPFPTQPFPLKPAPLSFQTLDSQTLNSAQYSTTHTPDVNDSMTIFTAHTARIARLKFIPPDTAATFLFGYSGGAEWGGNATTPDGILYQNANNDAWELRMVDRDKRDRELATLSPGKGLYIKSCSPCHGTDRKGNGTQYPALLDIGKRRDAASIVSLIKTGSGRMPSFSYLSDNERNALVSFLLNKETHTAPSEHASITDTAHGPANSFPYLPKYVYKTWRRMADANGHNTTPTPWGTLNAINLNTGDYLWRVPFGEYPNTTQSPNSTPTANTPSTSATTNIANTSPTGTPTPTGTENYGGPVVTAGDLLFIAATRDEKLRAFNRHTGAIVWEYQLPAGGFATPITYQINGKQYIAIAAGGARGAKPGGWYIAFSLP